MKEKYLHYLWQYKLMPLHSMALTDGRQFKLIHQGDYNANESGPDFLNAKIEIDGITWIGNVEIHVKSKDWFAHNHHFDKAYDSVILHVVYQHNGDVKIGETILPVLEIKDFIDKNHYQRFEKLLKAKKTILCGSSLLEFPPIYFIEMQERALVQRLSRKTNNLFQTVHSTDPQNVLYFLIARAMGTKVNQLPFEELTHRLPLGVIQKMKKKRQAQAICLASGLFIPESENDVLISSQLKQNGTFDNRVFKSAWKQGGVRPSNHPSKRIAQFAYIVQKFDFSVSFVYLTSKELYQYIIELLDLSKLKMTKDVSLETLTLSFKHQLIINCFSPFLVWYGNQLEDEALVEKGIDLLRQIPSEENGIIKKWRNYGIVPKNAAESQALLEIFNEFCVNKKCLTCTVGNKLLSK
jgi:hypothetical protein